LGACWLGALGRTRHGRVQGPAGPQDAGDRWGSAGAEGARATDKRRSLEMAFLTLCVEERRWPVGERGEPVAGLLVLEVGLQQCSVQIVRSGDSVD
jgi:hypothetical protein